jgi:hypothetical protein
VNETCSDFVKALGVGLDEEDEERRRRGGLLERLRDFLLFEDSSAGDEWRFFFLDLRGSFS